MLCCVYLVAGCGGGGKRPVEAKSPSGELGRTIVDSAKLPEGGFYSGGCVVTYKQGDLQGILPPVTPAPVITRGNEKLKRVALTIDDGWNADPRILQYLKENNIKFTAFLIGGRGVAESHPELVQAILDAGGEVCTHTYSHYVMSGKDRSFVVNELWEGQEAITRVTHRVYPYVRFSGGAYDQNSLDWAAGQGFWVVNWSVSTGDTAANPSVDAQVASTVAGATPGAIILCHFGGHNTYEVLQKAIPQIQTKGLEVTSLTRVLEGTPYLLKRGQT